MKLGAETVVLRDHIVENQIKEKGLESGGRGSCRFRMWVERLGYLETGGHAIQCEAQLRKTTCMNRLGDGSSSGYFITSKLFLCSHSQTPDLLGFLYSFRKMRQNPLEKE